MLYHHTNKGTMSKLYVSPRGTTLYWRTTQRCTGSSKSREEKKAKVLGKFEALLTTSTVKQFKPFRCLKNLTWIFTLNSDCTVK